MQTVKAGDLAQLIECLPAVKEDCLGSPAPQKSGLGSEAGCSKTQGHLQSHSKFDTRRQETAPQKIDIKTKLKADCDSVSQGEPGGAALAVTPGDATGVPYFK